jgi:hypothetical protein
MPSRGFSGHDYTVSHTFLGFLKEVSVHVAHVIKELDFKECRDVLLLTEISCSFSPL